MSNETIITAQPGLPTIDIAREVDAPVGDVFRAYTDPALIGQWLGPRRLKMELHEFDPRAGGSWSYVHRDPDGTGYGFHGVFHSVEQNRRIVQTFEFEGVPGHVSLEAVSFEDIDGRTRISVHSVYQSVEDRDGMVAAGMSEGVNEGYERLDELLAAGLPA